MRTFTVLSAKIENFLFQFNDSRNGIIILPNKVIVIFPKSYEIDLESTDLSFIYVIRIIAGCIFSIYKSLITLNTKGIKYLKYTNKVCLNLGFKISDGSNSLYIVDGRSANIR